MNKKELQEILKKHLKWLKDTEDGKRANLRDANLRDANLQDADLLGANLLGAYLRDANLLGAGGIPLTCPEEGAFIGWKKAYKN